MQAYNRYVPPDQEGTTSANQLTKRRAPGTLRDGKQTVRFEMPFAVWCTSCKPHAIIGQGVRFNAEKKKVGHYYSTPIWCFRMRHTACGSFLEIRTDPKNTAYVVTEGGKARDYGDAEDKVREGEGGVPILTAAEREARRQDAFAELEGKVVEKKLVKDTTKRISELYRASERDWDDPWMANKRMRTSFRHERKVRKREQDQTEALQERLGTEMELLPATEEDAKRAKFVSYGDSEAANDAERKALFPERRDLKPAICKSTSAKESRRDALQRQILGNTRAAANPFGGRSKGF